MYTSAVHSAVCRLVKKNEQFREMASLQCSRSRLIQRWRGCNAEIRIAGLATFSSYTATMGKTIDSWWARQI